MSLLLDSVILIDHFRGIEAASTYLAETHRKAKISVITRAEVLAGFDDASMPGALALLDRFAILPIDTPVADLAARLRREHRWKMPDALQAATARYHSLFFVTRNTKDFPPERFSWVKVPYAV